MEHETQNFTVVCPCCEAQLTIDAQTGAVLTHEEKTKKVGSFGDMMKELDKQKETREKLFAQELNAQKDRDRLLEEKFRAALKRSDELPDDEKGKPFKNPLDLD